MPNKINFIIWLMIGIILLLIPVFFYIGTPETLSDQLQHHFASFFFARVAAGTFVGMLWSPVSFLLYKIFIEKEYPQLPFLTYIRYSIIVYFLASMLASGVFIYLAWPR